MKLTKAQKKNLQEVFFAWLGLVVLSRIAKETVSVNFIHQNLALVTAALELYIPIGIYFFKREKIDFLDNSLYRFGKSLLVFALLSFVIFPLGMVWNHFYHQLIIQRDYHEAVFHNVGQFVVFQLIVIALPEEFFFRGYLQGRLNDVFGRPWKWKLLGAQLGPAYFIVCGVFAVSHSLMQFQWWHVFIIFPAAAFGWLREKTGSITASIFFHALSNVFARWTFIHYGSMPF